MNRWAKRKRFLFAVAGQSALPTCQTISRPTQKLLQSHLRFFYVAVAFTSYLASFQLVFSCPRIAGSLLLFMPPLALAESSSSGFLLSLISDSRLLLPTPDLQSHDLYFTAAPRCH